MSNRISLSKVESLYCTPQDPRHCFCIIPPLQLPVTDGYGMGQQLCDRSKSISML